MTSLVFAGSNDAVRAPSAGAGSAGSPGTSTILVVDDDAAVRRVAARALEREGYRVIRADGPEKALQLVEEDGAVPDLLLTDVVMPSLNGRELAERIREHHPDLPVLYMSAYTEDDVLLRGIRVAEVAFVAKPFTLEQLSRAVRSTLADV